MFFTFPLIFSHQVFLFPLSSFALDLPASFRFLGSIPSVRPFRSYQWQIQLDSLGKSAIVYSPHPSRKVRYVSPMVPVGIEISFHSVDNWEKYSRPPPHQVALHPIQRDIGIHLRDQLPRGLVVGRVPGIVTAIVVIQEHLALRLGIEEVRPWLIVQLLPPRDHRFDEVRVRHK